MGNLEVSQKAPDFEAIRDFLGAMKRDNEAHWRRLESDMIEMGAPPAAYEMSDMDPRNMYLTDGGFLIVGSYNALRMHRTTGDSFSSVRTGKSEEYKTPFINIGREGAEYLVGRRRVREMVKRNGKSGTGYSVHCLANPHFKDRYYRYEEAEDDNMPPDPPQPRTR